MAKNNLVEALLDMIMTKRFDRHTPLPCPPGKGQHCWGGGEEKCRKCWFEAARVRAGEGGE